jgi:hypothetical protein
MESNIDFNGLSIFLLGIIVNIVYYNFYYVKYLVLSIGRLDIYSVFLLMNILGLVLILKKMRFNLSINFRINYE